MYRFSFMRKVIFILGFTAIFLGFGIPPKMEKKIDKEIINVFEVKDFYKEVVVIDQTIESTLPIRFNQDNFKKILINDDHVGYFYFGIAPSKTDTFDYVVIFDQNLIIKKIKILAYREDYGMEIGSKRWLKQFYSLKKTDQVIYGQDIKAISGATISAQSMTNAMNKLMHSIEILQENNLL